jgi:cobalt-zinc-cadmium efflux system protein
VSHDHHNGHTHGADASQTRILLTFLLIAAFMFVEAIGGWWAGSLTLIADAGHMLTDSAALALAWFAARALRRPSDSAKTYGHDRFSVLAALINGIGLILIVAWIAGEAVQRLIAPEPVKAWPMLGIAATGLLVNSTAFLLLHGADRGNLNVRAALLHVIGDILASLAAVVAAVIILARPAWVAADPILSVVAGGLILRNAIDLVQRSWHVLMEGTPEGVDVSEIETALGSLEGVTNVHHLHVWSLAPGKPLITLHACVGREQDPDEALARIKRALIERFQIAHSTIQMERICPDPHRDHAEPENTREAHDSHGHPLHNHHHPHRLAAGS